MYKSLRVFLSLERKSYNIHETGNKINYRAHTSVKFNYSGALFLLFGSPIARPQGEFYCFVCERRIVSWIVFLRNPPFLKDIGTGGFRLIILNACRKLASYVVMKNPNGLEAFYYSKIELSKKFWNLLVYHCS